MVDSSEELTAILSRMSSGDEAAREELFDRVYHELKSMARGFMARERADHTLQPTALVNEAVLRLLGGGSFEQGGDRSYFFGAMSLAMRRVLVDHARQTKSKRRGAGQRGAPLDDFVAAIEEAQQLDLLALDEALNELEVLRPRQAEIVVRRFFGGFDMQEIAEQLGVSASTVQTDWRTARAWLRERLTGPANTDS